MGGWNIPLAVNPAPQNPGPMDLAQKGLNVQALINATQLQKQTQAQNALKQQSDQIELEQQQQGQKDQETFNKAFHDAGGDWDQTIKNATQAGASGAFITKAQLARTDQVTKLATANKDLLANEQTKADQLAKDALAVRNAPADEQASLYASLRNKHIIAGTYKPNEIPEQLPSNDELDATVAHSTAAQAIMKDAADLREKNAKLPGEQAEARGKSLTTASQTMNGVPNQLAWTARRNMLVGNDPTLKDLIPEQYSPDAVEQVRQLGITPQQAAQTPVEKQELASFMAKPPAGYKATPVDFMRYQKTIAPTLNFALQNQGAAADVNGNPSQIAQALANKQMKWSDAVSARTPQSVKNQILQQVFKIDHNFDTGEFGLEQDAAKKARSGVWADTRLAYNTALDHSDLLLQAAKALNNGDVQALNSLKNKFKTQLGWDGQITYQAIANAYNHEVNSVISKGHITDKEVETGHATLPDNANMQTIQSVVSAYKGLMSSKRDELNKIIKAGAGNKADATIAVGSSSDQNTNKPATHPFFDQFGGQQRAQ